MEVAFDNVHRQNDFYMMKNRKHIMEEDESGFDKDDHFDTEPPGPGSSGEGPNTTTTSEDNENTHLEEATIAQIIQEEIKPLQDAIETLTEVYLEKPKWCTDLSKLANNLIESIPGESSNKRGAKATSDDWYNISALQFQAAMLQPCNGQVLPAYVRDEIDRLYSVEKKYATAIRANRALTLIVDHDPVMLRLPEDPDERLLLMEVLNEWYTKEYPERKPLTLKQPEL